MLRMDVTTGERILSVFEVGGVILMLFLAFGFQLILKELPCPLCLLQRVGFLGIAFGFLLNLRFGFRPSHYGIVLLSAIYTAFVALRQVALHAIPGSGYYGAPIFGLHLYTWCFLIAMAIIVCVTLALSVDQQYLKKTKRTSVRWRYWIHFLFLLVTLLIIANLISVLLECGFSACPDNPTQYKWLFHSFFSAIRAW